MGNKDSHNEISRRGALKRMGMLVAGAVAWGVPSLSSCSGDRKKRIILYFTATGNCLYVARQLAGENAELLSILQLVKQGRYELEADEIGIVYPIYGHMPPNMVRQFIQKARLKAGYKFAVLTYGATGSVTRWKSGIACPEARATASTTSTPSSWSTTGCPTST